MHVWRTALCEDEFPILTHEWYIFKECSGGGVLVNFQSVPGLRLFYVFKKGECIALMTIPHALMYVSRGYQPANTMEEELPPCYNTMYKLEVEFHIHGNQNYKNWKVRETNQKILQTVRIECKHPKKMFMVDKNNETNAW